MSPSKLHCGSQFPFSKSRMPAQFDQISEEGIVTISQEQFDAVVKLKVDHDTLKRQADREKRMFKEEKESLEAENARFVC